MSKTSSTRGAGQARSNPMQTQAPGSREQSSTSDLAATGESSRLTPEERQLWIATAAYYHAEHRGFAPGGEMDDWRAAEAEIEELSHKE